jgi:uncharacterized phage-like protein YoqJ
MIIAGTGHRPDKLGGYDPYTNSRVLSLAMDVLRQNQPSTVISGMAQGWDMAIAQAAVNLNIPFHAYIPFVGQELVWPSATRLYYKALLQQAQHVVVCSEGGYTKAAMQVRNQRMVDECDLLVALWNGSKGGTENCVLYAILTGRPYINYWPQFLDPTQDLAATPQGSDWLGP